jgi:hypothetical protein
MQTFVPRCWLVLARLWMSGCAEGSSNKPVSERGQGHEAKKRHRGCRASRVPGSRMTPKDGWQASMLRAPSDTREVTDEQPCPDARHRHDKYRADGAWAWSWSWSWSRSWPARGAPTRSYALHVAEHYGETTQTSIRHQRLANLGRRKVSVGE